MSTHKHRRITLRRLEVFVEIVNSGGFRAAADRLGLAQPSVSNHVQALEVEAGGMLFRRRRGSGVELTDLGKTFLTHAKQLLAEVDSMADNLDQSRAEAERRVIFACQRSLADFMPPLVAEFARDHRDIELMTRVGRQEEIVDMIKDGAANIGLYLSNRDIPGLSSTVIGHEEIAVVASRNHPLAGRRKIPPAELDHHPFVGAPAGSLFGESILQMLAGIGVREMKVVSTATEYEFLRALVLADVGLYCCLRKRARPEIDSGALVMLDLDAPPLMMEVRQMFSIKRQVSPSVVTFAEFLRRRQQHYLQPLL
ncbi:LysR family transcriptional regulator [Mesorhizobium sp. KR1-2]|uniref:LysR family transcriptional regulator n=1 Tax=Mesorhizobium sp. KR1-2 TaxID=3156609 RepID=UPI0032B3E16C